MELTRKRKRELKKLQGRAQNVWSEQKLVLERARELARDAKVSGTDYARNEGLTAARGAYDTRVRPAVESGKVVVSGARDKVVTDIAPALSAAIATALASITTVREGGEKGVDTAVKTVTKKADVAPQTAKVAKAAGKKEVAKAAAKAAGKVAKSKKKGSGSAGPGKFILGSFLLVAVAGVAYAVWQTLRADDELWIADEELETSPDGTTTDGTTTVTPADSSTTGTSGSGTTGV